MAKDHKKGQSPKSGKKPQPKPQLETRNAMSNEEQQPSAPAAETPNPLAGIEIQSVATGEPAAFEADTGAQLQAVETPAEPQPAANTPPAVEEPAPAPAPAPTPAPTPAPAPKAAEAAVPMSIGLPAMPEGLKVASLSPLMAVVDYMQNMDPKKPIDAETGGRHQANLYRNLLWVINRLEGEEFTRAWRWLLSVFNDYRGGVFNDKYVFRFFEQVPLGENDRKAFQKLLNVMKVTADPKGRRLALKQVSLDKSLALGVTEPGRQRVLQFYQA